MRTRFAFFGLVAIVFLLLIEAVVAADPTKEELLATVGIKPSGSQRGQMDIVGFVTTSGQMDAVIEQSAVLAAPRLDTIRVQTGWTDDTSLFAAVCPHDDYYYASRLYALVTPFVRAKTVVLFGVFHKARVFDCRDRLVFDSFQTWRGPYGPVTVSPLRSELIERLAPTDYIVDDDMHTVEHSLEAIVPWLQAFDRDVQIIPILVPYMGWDTMDRLAGELAEALTAVMRENGLQLGVDVALVCSADAIHYGDAGWGGGSYADFGTDVNGYAMAVSRDQHLMASTLAGPVTRGALEKFLYTCVNQNDVTQYVLTWCGRFSVPFGLDVASRVCESLEGRPLEGMLLGYGTSVEEISLDLDDIEGLGTTAPNNLHHWVGYPAIGYR